MKTLHLSIIVICALIGIFSTEIVSAITENSTTIIPPPYPNSSNLIMHYNLTSPALHTPLSNKSLDFTIPHNTYSSPGENITISGNAGPANVVTVILKNPHGKTIETYSVQSDSTGLFSFSLKIPDDAIFGVWNVEVTDGFTSTVRPLTVEYASPLKQFISGTDAKSTECDPGLYLVIKSEDGSPACVTTDSAQRLVKDGWAKEIVVLPDISSHPIVGVISIQMIPPYTPAGPTIQMMIKNNGGRPITNLKAVLELYNNYAFDFKNISYLTPLSAGNYSSDTKTLIGGGFDDEMPYPLVISGIAGGIPFNFTENIHIPYTAENKVENQANQSDEFDGVIVDQSFTTKHAYSFFTNDTSVKFDTGSGGIYLEGVDNTDGLDGKHVRLFGIVPDGEDEIKVEKFQILGSYVPRGTPARNMTQQVTIDDLYNNPDKYYNQTITIMGQLSEYDNPIAYAGVGCLSAPYTTSQTFVPDFASRHQLYDGEHYIGVRIGGTGDVGYSPTDRLPANLKNKPVTVTGILVPELYDTGMCMHVLHKSGYILTDFSKIHPIGG